GEAPEQAVGERHIDVAAEVDAVVAAEGHFPDAAEFLVGLRRYDVEGAADGVLAEQGALGTAQHLHALDIGEIHDAPGGAAEVDAVHVDADGRIAGDDEVRLPDPADEHGGNEAGAAALRPRAEIQVGNEVAHIGKVQRKAIGEVLSGEGGDRYRRLLQALLAPLRGD